MLNRRIWYFFSCANSDVKLYTSATLHLPSNLDADGKITEYIIYELKDLRNAVAHNNIIFDTRFKDRKISPVLKKWVEKETGIQNITLYSLIDYIIIVCCLLKRVDFSGTRALTLLNKYKEENQRLQNSVASEIYDHIIQNNVPAKVVGLEAYLNV